MTTEATTMVPTTTLTCLQCGREDEVISTVHRDATDLALPASLLYLVDRPRACGLCATTSSGVPTRV
jgi:hypothetical protein